MKILIYVIFSICAFPILAYSNPEICEYNGQTISKDDIPNILNVFGYKKRDSYKINIKKNTCHYSVTDINQKSLRAKDDKYLINFEGKVVDFIRGESSIFNCEKLNMNIEFYVEKIADFRKKNVLIEGANKKVHTVDLKKRNCSAVYFEATESNHLRYYIFDVDGRFVNKGEL